MYVVEGETGSEHWVYLGDTNLDLTNYPTKSGNETITGYWSFSHGTTFSDGITTNYIFNQGDITLDAEQGEIIVNGTSIRPYITNTYDLGSSTYTFKDLYLGGKIYINNGRVCFTSNESHSIGYYSANYISIGVPNFAILIGNKEFVPATNSDSNLGKSSNKWKDLYLSGNIYGATYNEAFDDIYTTINNYNESGTTEIKWSKMLTFSISADTTFTFETAKTNCLNEYKAIITNSGASTITLTFTGVSKILCNDDNCVVTNGTNSTLTLPSGTTIECSVLNNCLVAINFSAN